MGEPPARAGHLVLLTGPRGVGKTTCCQRLVELLRRRHVDVDGIVTEGGAAAGGAPLQTVVDLGEGSRHDLARVDPPLSASVHGPVLDPTTVGVEGPTLTWHFDEAGLELGRRVLRRCLSRDPDVVVVDQIGPLELLAGGGWTEALELAGGHRALTVVVTNEAVVDEVADRLHGREPLIVRVGLRDRDGLPALLANLVLQPRGEHLERGACRLLAADLDGTLLATTPDGQRPASGVPPALNGLLADGIQVVVCTGRPVARTREAARQIGIDRGLAISFHGAVIADLGDGRWLRRIDLPHGAASAAVRLAGGRATAYVGDEVWEAKTVDDWDPGTSADSTRRRVVDLAAELRGVDVTRLILHPPPGSDEHDLAAAVCAACPDVRVGPAPGGRLAVHHAQVGKLSTLRRLCEGMDVGADEVVAAGDDLDDADVLAWAGLGICVRGGDPAALAAADIVISQSRLGPLLGALPRAAARP